MKKYEPTSGTRKLAVDLRALLKQRTLSRFRTGVCQKTKTIMEQMAACTEKGLHGIIAVVGNVEDMSEVTFVPTPVDLRYISPAEKSAVAQVAKVQRDISAFWTKPRANGRPSTGLPEPFIRVEKVQHIASAPLPRFPRLPPSIHRFTWVHTCSSPGLLLPRT